MGIAAEAALIDVAARSGRSHAEMQRSLARGRCAACDMPVRPNGRRRRTCLCARCQETLAWCSTCQRAKGHAAFPRCRSNANGLNGECKDCRALRRPRMRTAAPPCARSGCASRAAEGRRGSYHKLCQACLRTHAWCSDCDRARPRGDFYRDVRAHERHAAICRACDRARRPRSGDAAERSQAARARYAAIREYAAAHPTAERAAIAQALGVSLNQITDAMRALGFTIGHGPKRAAALERYAAVVNLSPAEIMGREGLSYSAAVQLRVRARKALLAEAGGAGS